MANEEFVTKVIEETVYIPVLGDDGKMMGIINPDHSNVEFGFIPCGDVENKYDSYIIKDRIDKALEGICKQRRIKYKQSDDNKNKVLVQEMKKIINSLYGAANIPTNYQDLRYDDNGNKTHKNKKHSNGRKTKITINCTIEINN